MTTWVATDPLLEVGNGTSSSATSNALTVLKNGNTSLGTTAPTNKLEVHHNSSTASTQLFLKETANDFSRIAFANTSTTNQWHFAGLPQATTASATLNIWYQPTGDVVRIAGDGQFWLKTMNAYSSANPLCSDTASGSGKIGHCSSSRRYKTDIDPFGLGLELVERMRPVSFTSLSTGQRDLGFIAEEMAQIHPLLATYDEQGRPESVRYLGLTAVLAKAVQEQQITIHDQQTELQAEHREIESLRSMVAEQQRAIDQNARALRELSDAVAALRAAGTRKL